MRYMPDLEHAREFGFEWTGNRLVNNGSSIAAESRLVVQRTARVKSHGGKTRILTVFAEAAIAEIYVSPTGRIRVFIDGKEAKRAKK